MEGKVVLLKQVEKEKTDETTECDKIKKTVNIQPKQICSESFGNRRNVNAFSASTFVQNEEKVEKKQDGLDCQDEILSQDLSSTIFTPNYDMMESLNDQQHEQIFGKQNQNEVNVQEKKRKWSIKSVVFAILIAIFGIWGIINISTIEKLDNQIQAASDIYNLNLANYLKNLTALDTTNQENMENLFEVIPSQTTNPTTIGETSNWFDRFCNFLAGLFGG